MAKSKNIQLRIPIGLNERIEKAAITAKSEKNDFIRSSLDQYVREKYEKDEELLSKIERMLGLAKINFQDLSKETFDGVELAFIARRNEFEIYKKMFEEKHYGIIDKSLTQGD